MKKTPSAIGLTQRGLLPLDEWCVAIALFVILYTFEFNPGRFFDAWIPVYQHLGGEYYSIAEALVDGRGYSDPFAEISGPTAWMPPVYPLLLAGLLKLLHTRAAVGEAVVLLTVISLTAVGVMLFKMAKRSASQISPYVIVGFYVGWLWTFHFWFCFFTHDVWLLTLLTGCIAWNLHRFSLEGRFGTWRWGILGGLAALTSPTLAVAWFVLSVVLFFKSQAIRKQLVLGALLASCMTAPWLARNALVFHRFIPTKSNVFYEAYQANYRYPDGIYDNTWDEHPNVSSRYRFAYAKQGEVAFMQEHKQKFWAALKDDPGRYVHNVLRRLLAVTAVHPERGSFDSPIKLAVKRYVYPLPFLGLLIALWGRGARQPLLARLTLLWGVYLLPYVLVAFYLRYVLPMTPCLMLMAFFGADELASRVARRWPAFIRARQIPETHG